jgi:hypothetical protein
MTHIYRLYTEHQSETALYPLISALFSGATIYASRGLWEGKTEPSTVIEILGSLDDRAKVFLLARNIREAFAQTAVLVTIQNVSTFEVRA